MNDAQRDRFDVLMDKAIGELPTALHDLIREIPVVVDDRPSADLVHRLRLPPGVILCGLHTGIALTNRSVEQSGVPTDVIRLFREGIVRTAGGWRGPHAEDAIYEQIAITLLHEIGHHFGLDEDDLDALGYG